MFRSFPQPWEVVLAPQVRRDAPVRVAAARRPRGPEQPISLCVLDTACARVFPSQVLHEEIELPGSNVKLRYLSSRTAGYKSLLKITMTQSTVPLNLIKVHLMVAVEGHLFQKSFQASSNLAYTFIWDKTDAYGQRVYGLSDAVGMFQFPPLIDSWIQSCVNSTDIY